MAILIASYNSDGCTGRCDAKCYNAVGGKCDCICHGMSHGVGIDKARGNTAELADKWIEQWQIEHPDDKVKIGSEVIQQKLF